MLAPAKLNLYLDVVGRRPDGYHDLETLFLALPWGDEIELAFDETRGVHLELEADDPSVPVDQQNLAVKAAQAYLDRAGQRGRIFDVGISIRLGKRTPAGAGLGGGSSDAAAVLRWLQRETRALSETDVLELAGSLGADVPFFLLGARAAIGRGRGDLLEPIPAQASYDVVLILPGTGHETARVFGTVELGPTHAPRGGLGRARDAYASGEPDRLRDAHYNALETPAVRAYPAFGSFLEEVERRLGRRPCLTGTGSTLYDLPGPGEVTEVLDRLHGLDARVLHVPKAPDSC